MKFYHYNKSKSILVWLITILAIIYLIGVISLLMLAVKALVLYSTELLVPAIIIIAMCIVALLYTLDIVLWQIIGKEHIEITNNEIKAHQYGRIFNKKKIIRIDSIKSITKRIYSLKGINHYWFPSKQGSIIISIGNKNIHIGRNISEEEIDILVKTIQNNTTNNFDVSTKNEMRDYSKNEIMFYIWIIFCITLGLPAFIWVPFLDDYEKQTLDARISYIERNYSKKYYYSNIACRKVALAEVLAYCDSANIKLYCKQCDINDSVTYEHCNGKSQTYSTHKRIIPQTTANNLFLYNGVVYLVDKKDSLYVVYTTKDLNNLYWIHARYVHDSIPETINELDRKQIFGF